MNRFGAGEQPPGEIPETVPEPRLTHAEIEAQVQAYLAAGNVVHRPQSAQLRCEVGRGHKNGMDRRWVEAPTPVTEAGKRWNEKVVAKNRRRAKNVRGIDTPSTADTVSLWPI